jgi:hypothetical protein
MDSACSGTVVLRFERFSVVVLRILTGVPFWNSISMLPHSPSSTTRISHASSDLNSVRPTPYRNWIKSETCSTVKTGSEGDLTPPLHFVLCCLSFTP